MDGWHNGGRTAADVAPSHVFVEVPTVRPADPLAREIGDRLYRIVRNYEREGSGPGSRFEGQLLEDVLATAVIGWLLNSEQELTGLPVAVWPPKLRVRASAQPYVADLACEDHGVVMQFGNHSVRTIAFEARRHWRESHG